MISIEYFEEGFLHYRTHNNSFKKYFMHSVLQNDLF